MTTTPTRRTHMFATCTLAASLTVLTLVTTSSRASAGKKTKVLPSPAMVQKVVKVHLAKLPEYQEGDILCRSDVEPIFRQLAKIGWKAADAKKILGEMLDANNFLIKELRTDRGRQFMRKVSGDPSVYDRLDRVARHRRGPATIRSLVRLPNGEKYAKADPGRGNPSMSDLVLIYDRGAEQNRKLKDYNKPTGRIYTADQFLKRLSRSYQKARRRAS